MHTGIFNGLEPPSIDLKKQLENSCLLMFLHQDFKNKIVGCMQQPKATDRQLIRDSINLREMNAPCARAIFSTLKFDSIE